MRASQKTTLLATLAVLAIGFAIAGLVVLAVDSDAGPPDTEISLGFENKLISDIEEGGPIFFANPTGGEGFYVALDDSDLVAVVRKLPNTDCEIRWRDSKGGFRDCDGKLRELSELAFYRSYLSDGKNSPEPKGAFVVDVSETLVG